MITSKSDSSMNNSGSSGSILSNISISNENKSKLIFTADAAAFAVRIVAGVTKNSINSGIDTNPCPSSNLKAKICDVLYSEGCYFYNRLTKEIHENLPVSQI